MSSGKQNSDVRCAWQCTEPSSSPGGLFLMHVLASLGLILASKKEKLAFALNPTPQGRDPVKGSGLACTTTSPLEGSTLHFISSTLQIPPTPLWLSYPSPSICTSQPGHLRRLSLQGSTVYSVASHWTGQALSGPRVAVLKSQDSWFHRAPSSPQPSWAANSGGRL